jgi:hypothetical protein
MKFRHNHPLNAADALKHRDVGDDVKQKLIQMFQDGYSPSGAHTQLLYDLQMEHGEDYVVIAADRKYCPSGQDVYR